MSQEATGSANIQISVAQSQSIAITINGQLAVKLISPEFPRQPLGGQLQEIDLLKASHASIPFAGRTDLLNEFLTWCQHPRPVSFRILTGQGGSGKTRFAYELYGRIRQQTDWAGHFFDFYKDEAKEVNLWNELSKPNSLLVADYAADYAQPVADILRSLTASPPPTDGRRIRILLLARTGDWQQGWLRDLRSGRTGGEIDRLFHPRDPIQFSAFTSAERRQIFQSACERFAQLNAKPLPAIPEAQVFERPDVADRLADPLTLAMAAATAFQSGSANALSMNRTDLAFEVAENLVAGRMRESVKSHQDFFLHMAAFATLCGGLTREEALCALQSEADATKLGRVPDPESFLNKLQAWLPAVARPEQTDWIGAIQPDIVGEAFVMSTGNRANPLAMEATVLRARECRGQGTLSAVIRSAQDFSFAATRSRMEPISWMQSLIQAAESDQDFSRLAELSEAMPLESVPLRNSAFRAAASLVSKLRALAEDAPNARPGHRLAWALHTLSVRQSEVGQRAEALETAREAVQLYGELAGQNRAAFLPALASSLNNLAAMQSAVGQRAEALATAREAVQLYGELAGQNRAAFLPALASSLNNLATMQSAVGQRAEALATAREAVQLYGELAGQNRAAFLPALASSLNNLAAMQSEVGQRAEALATAREAVQLYGELAGQNRAAFLPDLAMSLNNLANRQSAVGQRAEALETAREAVQFRRELAGQNRAAFLPDLAMSLNNLANRQSAVGQRAEALATAREAVQLYGELAGQNRAAFLPDLAMSLNNLANRQSEVGQRAEALETAREAVQLYGELAGQNRAAFLPDLASSLNNLAARQSEVGQRAEALETAREAVQLYGELAGQNRAAFLPDLAMSLNNLAKMKSEVGQRAEALATAREAVQLYGELAGQNRAAFLPDLASSLNNLATMQSAVGQRAEALATAREAVQLYGELAGQNRAAFLPALASSLNNLANMQSEVGRRAEALETAREAVQFRRELAGQNRAAFLPALAMSLNNLANMQSGVGQRAEALETAREAVTLCRQMYEGHSEAFADFLARALWTMGGVFSQLNQYSEATSSLAQGLRTILPETERYPLAHLSPCLALARDYVAAAEAAQVAPDSELVSELIRIIGPYLSQTDSGEHKNE